MAEKASGTSQMQYNRIQTNWKALWPSAEREVIIPSHTALLVVDMQKGFTEPESPFCVAMAKDTVNAIAQTVEKARKAGCLVIWVMRKHEPDGSDLEAFRKKKLEALGWLDLFASDTWGFELAEGLVSDVADRFCYKTRYSAFFKTDLTGLLEENGISTVLVAGTQTPNCVRATAVDAFQHGYRTMVLTDCTSSASDAVQQANLYDMQTSGIEMADSAELFECCGC